MRERSLGEWRSRPGARPRRRYTVAAVTTLERRELLTLSVLKVQAVEGVPFTGAVAKFAKGDVAGTKADFSATIDWGDGTLSAGTITEGPTDTFTVAASHTYAKVGSHPLLVTIDGKDGTRKIETGTATVEIAPPIARGIVATVGMVFTGVVATVKRPPGASPGEYAATIQWGDGRPLTSATIVDTPEGFEIVGSKRYSATGKFPVEVTILRLADNQRSSRTGEAVVTAPVVSSNRGVSIGLDPASDTGASQSDGVTHTNQPRFQGTAPAYSVVRLLAKRPTDPAATSLGSTITRADGGWSLSVGPLADGVYTITASVTPPSGQSVLETSSTVVIDADPSHASVPGPRARGVLTRPSGPMAQGFARHGAWMRRRMR